MSDSATLWIVSHQAPPSMRFPRQEYWHGLLFPSPGDLPDPEIKPMSPALVGKFFTTEPPGKPINYFQKRSNSLSALIDMITCRYIDIHMDVDAMCVFFLLTHWIAIISFQVVN